MNRVLMLSVLMLMVLAAEALSQTTITYEGVVLRSFGPYSAQFPPGEAVTVTYTLDPTVVDSNSDPSTGAYINAVLSMSVSFPNIGIFANAGPAAAGFPANVHVRNDFESESEFWDQVFVSGGQILSSSLLGGEPILDVGADFRESATPPATPSMISSDALPLVRLPLPHHVLLETPTFGFTPVFLAPAGRVVVRNYGAEVISSSGPHAAAFPAGEPVEVAYALDSLASDSVTDPSRGVFDNAVLSLSVNFPGLAVFANAGHAGRGQTFDNVVAPTSGVLSDQVFLFGGPISSASPLGGEPITQVEVDFLSDFVVPPSEPSMLSSDALPLFRLPMTDSFVILRTSSGTTFVHFAPPAPERIQSLIDDVEELSAAGTLTEGQTDWLIRKLEVAIASIDRGNTRPACNHLQQFIRRVEDHIDGGTLSPAEGQALIDAARSIQGQIGC